MSEQVKVKDGRRFNFTMIENSILDDTDKYSRNEVFAYIILCRYANNNDNTCFPSYKTIAEKMRCSKRTAELAINGLVEKGVIKKEVRKIKNSNENNTNVYTIVGESTIDGVDRNIQKQREEKAYRQNQLKELNEHPNVQYMKQYAPHIRLGRNQKLELIELDYETLTEAVDRSMVYGAKTWNYILNTYNTVVEEMKLSNNSNDISAEVEPEEETNVREFVPSVEFTPTELHQVAYINYIEKGFDGITSNEQRLVLELEQAGKVSLGW
jgi:predicted transcriptional regulator